VVFDLGGVLIELTGVDSLRRLTGIESRDEIIRRWLECPWVRRFESGGCSAQEFGAGVVAEWGLPLSAAEFLEEFGVWPGALVAGAVDLLVETRSVRTVACLSNTNDLHWEDHSRRWALDGLFDGVFLSHRIGQVKPDAAAFDHVAAALGVSPERLLLLDDSPLNVEGARAAGWRAERVLGPAAARTVLVEAGVLDAGGSPESDDGTHRTDRFDAARPDRPAREEEPSDGI
jgi:putative hydrolase of the HAD superfamily